MPEEVLSRLRLWTIIGLVVALALALRLHRISHENFSIDQISSVEVASQPLADLLRYYRASFVDQYHPANQAPIAFIAISHLFMSPEISEAAARLTAALLGAGAVLALFVLARRICSTPVASVAALLLALSPVHVWYSQETRWYAQWLFLTVLSLLGALARGRHGAPARGWRTGLPASQVSMHSFFLSP